MVFQHTAKTTYTASTSVIACGHTANQFSITQQLPLYPVRGVITLPTSLTQNLRSVL